jgi:6,7-dimethyl-8-ribityllumazine synthase
MSTQAPKYQPGKIASDARIAVVAARFNNHIVDPLLSGCLSRLAEIGIGGPHVDVHRVPGAFELPVAAKLLARTGRFHAIICLGCIIRGDTPHFEYISTEAARGIQQVAIDEALPVIFGVLTCDTEEQARDRSGGAHGHVGISAAETAVEMIALADKIKKTPR